MDSTPNLQLPYLMAAQAQKHVTHNEALRALDALVQLLVLDKDLASPPGSPAEGSRYIVAAGPTGAWAGQAAKIAAYQDGAWMFYPPGEGWLAWVADEDKLYVYSGTAWAEFTSPGTGAPLWGINTTADTTNRLALESPASLFDNVGNGHQQKINKAAAGDTASQLFQTNYSGRAEYGLTGDDNFHVKVSPDGSAWTEAIVVDRTTGAVDVAKAIRAQDYFIGIQATGPRAVAVGDSLTAGPGGGNSYPEQMTFPTWNGQAFTVTNIGVAGRTVQTMSRLAYSNLNPLFAHESGLNVAMVWGGTNDIAVAGASPQDTYSYLSSFCHRLQSQGQRVIVATMISRNGHDTAKNTLNGYIRAGWTTFADALADVAANASIGADGAYSNTTYFAGDGVHLNATGQAIVAGIMQAAITTIAQGTPNHFAPFGNVGFGTTSPTSKFHLKGAGAAIMRLEDSSATGYSGAALTGTGSQGYNLLMGGPSETAFGIANKLAIYDALAGVIRFVLDASGNFGFGTTAPASRAHVRGTGASILQVDDGSATGYSGIALTGTGSQGYNILMGGPSETGFGVANKLAIYDAHAVAMRIVMDSSGNVGIGTTGPSNKLAVEGIAAPETDNAYSCGTSGKRWSVIYAATGSINTSDQRLKADIADSPLGLDFLLHCRPRAYKWAEGKTDVLWDDEEYEVEEPVTEEKTVTQTVTEMVDGRAVEKRVQRTVQVPVFNHLAVIDAAGNPVMVDGADGEPARPKTYAMPRMARVTKTRKVKREVPRPGARTHFGLIAQEVKAALDQAGVDDFAGWVLEDKDDPNSTQSLRYDQFIAPLIKAVQELAARVAALEAQPGS